MTSRKQQRARGRFWETLSLGSLFMMIRNGNESVWPVVFLAVLLFWSIDLAIRHVPHIRRPFRQHPSQ